MAIMNKREFAEICNIAATSIPINIKRKKIIVDKKGNIDTTNEVNKAFYQRNVHKRPKVDPIKGIDYENLGASIAKPNAKDVEVITLTGDVVPELAVSERLLKHLDTQKREKEISLLEIRKQKLEGDVIPTELIAPLLLMQNQSLVIELKNGMEEIIREIAKQYDLKGQELANYRKRITEQLNESAKKSIDVSKKGLISIITDYSEKRGVGEKIN